MNLTELTIGERFIIEWQYRMAGDFMTALANAIMLADTKNILRLYKAFPDEVEAYINYSQKDGWWEKLQEKAECKLRST